MCDQASTNVAEVVRTVATRLNAEMHFSLVDSSHTLGTMERVNRDFRMVLQALVSEWELEMDDWPYCLPALQHSLNVTPVEALGGLAPLTVFNGRATTMPLDLVLRPTALADRVVAQPVDGQVVVAQTALLTASLADMHATVVAPHSRSAIAREQAYHVPINWTVGDFVMYSKPMHGPTNKTKGVWKGPYRVTEMISDSAYRVQNLVQPDITKVVHASRLAFYADSALELTTELLNVAQHNVEGFVVERLVSLSEVNGVFYILVKWLQLDVEENTWEPLLSLYDGVPVKVNAYLRKNRSRAIFRRAKDFLAQARRR